MMRQSLIIILLLLPLLLDAQEELTLPKAISIGLENNYGIKIADRAILIAENNNTWARAGKLPTIDLNGSFNNNFIQDNNPATFLQGTFYTGSASASIDAQMVLYSGGRIGFLKDQFGFLIEQEKLVKDQQIHQLLRDIYQGYYDVLFQQERLSVLGDAYDLSRSRLAYEEERKKYGISNVFNLIQFENAVITDSINLLTQQQAIEISKRNFYDILDISGYPNYAFKDRISVIPEKLAAEQLRMLLSEDNYTLKTLEMIVSLDRINTKLAKAAQKPQINAFANMAFAENGFKFFGTNPRTGEEIDFQIASRLSANFGFNLTYNLYDGGIRSTDVQNAEIQEDINMMNILEAKAALNNQLDILISNYNNQLTQLSLADQQINLAQQNLTITEERFKAGQVTSLDFRNIQNQYLAAAFNKVNAIYMLILTKSEIDFLVGSFSQK